MLATAIFYKWLAINDAHNDAHVAINDASFVCLTAIAVNAARILITQGEIYSLQIPKIVVHVHTNLFMNALTFVVRQCSKYRQCSLVLPVVASVRPIWGYALSYEGALIPWPGQILIPTMRILH
jgi:hypothetical protein